MHTKQTIARFVWGVVVFLAMIAGSQTHFLSRLAAGDFAAPYHIPTWAVDEYRDEGATVSAADVVRLVTYAETGYGNDKALKDCHSAHPGCMAVFYVQASKVFVTADCPSALATRFLAAARESWFVHEPGYSDAAHRLQETYHSRCHGVPTTAIVWQINKASPEVQAYFRSFLRQFADNYDYYFMDDTHAAVVNQFGGCPEPQHYCHQTQEFRSDTDVIQGTAAFVAAMTHTDGKPMQFFFNSLSFNGRPVADLRLLDATPQFVGASCENCGVDENQEDPQSYAPVLNTMAAFRTRGKIFVLLTDGDAPAGSQEQIKQRFVATALAWLGFDDDHTVVWKNLEFNTRNLAVWPEDMIYPTQPLQTMSSGATDLRVAPRVWRREFTTCYDRGLRFGACAALLNGNDQPVTVAQSWLHQQYTHLISVVGGDELSGGREFLNRETFTPGQTTIPAEGALLLAP
jgi:hypothetical protein